MSLRGIVVWAAVGLAGLTGVACGGGSDADPDARPVTLFDAPPPDASMPDAFVCVETETQRACGPGMAGCVDITRDPANCGACGSACTSGGQTCVPGPAADADAGVGNDVAHCACPPPDFVPATIVPIDLSQFGVDPVNPIQNTEYIAFGVFLGGGTQVHAIVVTFDTDADPVQIGVDIDLSTIDLSATSPRVGAGYNVDIMTQAVQAAYFASEGTLNLEYACPTGVAGTLTDAVFVEVEGLMNPTPAVDGCGFSVPSVSFAFGDDCTPDMPDAGA